MRLMLMTAVAIVMSLGVAAVAQADDKTVVVTPNPDNQPQIIIKSKGPLERSPLYRANNGLYPGVGNTYVVPENRKDRTETSSYTDANGITYQVKKYYKFDDDGSSSIRTVTTAPDGTETVQKTEVKAK